MDRNEFIYLKNINYIDYEEALHKLLRNNYSNDVHYNSIIISTILYIMQQNDIDNWEELYSYIMDMTLEKEVKKVLLAQVERIDDDILNIYESYNDDVIISYILFSKTPTFSKLFVDSTPDTVNHMALGLLDIKKGESLLEACSGKGSFFVTTAGYDEKFNLYGIEESRSNFIISKIRAYFLDIDMKVYNADIFSTEWRANKFDKIFSHYPLGKTINSITQDLAKYAEEYSFLKDINKNASSGWLYNLIIMDLLKENGKAVVVVDNAAIWNDSDTEFRRMFWKNRWVECVISLPAKILSSSLAEYSLLVLSKKNNSVKFIDASNYYTSTRRLSYMSEDQIASILDLYQNEDLETLVLDYEDIKYPYNLSAKHYLRKRDTKYDRNFDSIVFDIKRGASINSKQLDEMASREPTQFRYLKINNIDGGVIDSNMPYITGIAENQEHFILEDGNIILCKSGYPFKVAVYSKENNESVIPTGNMYIIRLDTTMYNPYFVKAYLESEDGQNGLIMLSKGTTIKNISIKDLRRLKIPNVSLEKQNEFVQRYVMLTEDIEREKEVLEDLIDSKNNLIKEFIK